MAAPDKVGPAADPAALAVAGRVSRRLEWRHRRRVEPGELLAPAYFGAVECPAFAALTAERRCRDYLRERDGRLGSGRRAGRERTKAVSWQGCRFDVEAPAQPPTPLETWAEWRDLRRRLPMRVRLLLYLYAIEGMTMREIAGAFGCAESVVSHLLARVHGRAGGP